MINMIHWIVLVFIGKGLGINTYIKRYSGRNEKSSLGVPLLNVAHSFLN